MRDANRAEFLVKLTADLVSAHLQNNNVGYQQVPEFIRSVHATFADFMVVEGAESDAPPLLVEHTAERVKKEEGIVCLECHHAFVMLRRHLKVEHQLSPEEYRTKWNLAKDYPLVSSGCSEKRRARALREGFGQKQRLHRSPPKQNGIKIYGKQANH